MQARFAFTEFFDSGYRFPIGNTDLPCSSRYIFRVYFETAVVEAPLTCAPCSLLNGDDWIRTVPTARIGTQPNLRHVSDRA